MNGLDRAILIVLQFLVDLGRGLAARAALGREAEQAAAEAGEGDTSRAEKLIREHGGPKT